MSKEQVEMFKIKGKFTAHSAADTLEEQAKKIRELGDTQLDLSIKVSILKTQREDSTPAPTNQFDEVKDYNIKLTDNQGKPTHLKLSLPGDMMKVKEQILKKYPDMKVSYILLSE